MEPVIEYLQSVAVENAALLRTLALGSLGFFVITPIAAPALIILMPADMLVRRRRRLRDYSPLRRGIFIFWHVVKNIVGIGLVIIGLMLLFLPGQGLLTIFAGTLLSDFPGKRGMLARLLGSGRVRPVIDKLRERYNRPPMIDPDRDESANPPGVD